MSAWLWVIIVVVVLLLLVIIPALPAIRKYLRMRNM